MLGATIKGKEFAPSKFFLFRAVSILEAKNRDLFLVDFNCVCKHNFAQATPPVISTR